MDDRDYSERLAAIARVVTALSGHHDDGHRVCPSPILVDELAQLVTDLQQDLDGARTLRRSRGAVATEPAAAARVSARRSGTVTAPAPSRASDDRWSGRVHGVHFARTHEHAVAAVVDMVCDAIDSGRAVVLVATGLHRRWIEDELHQRGVSAEELHVLDAATTLAALLVDGTPNRERFRSMVGACVADVAGRTPAGVSVYGEMVGLLWERGDAVAAMRLEHFWNELQQEIPFSLMCGYLLDRQTSRSDLEPIRRLHSHVM